MHHVYTHAQLMCITMQLINNYEHSVLRLEAINHDRVHCILLSQDLGYRGLSCWSE